MDKMYLKNMIFYGYHGVFEEEKEKGQEFRVDAELSVDLSKAGISDDLKDTVDYSKVYGIIKEITEQKRFDLIEKLASELCTSILSAFPEISSIKVLVKKPQAPIDGRFDWMGVEMERKRE